MFNMQNRLNILRNSLDRTDSRLKVLGRIRLSSRRSHVTINTCRSLIDIVAPTIRLTVRHVDQNSWSGLVANLHHVGCRIDLFERANQIVV